MTKKEYCINNEAYAYYLLDSYGYTTLYLHTFDYSEDVVYISYKHYTHKWIDNEYVEIEINTYHRLKTYFDDESGTYFKWYGRKIFFSEFLRLNYKRKTSA